jgi:hypothetical protein
MIHAAPHIMFWMRAYPLRGQVRGGGGGGEGNLSMDAAQLFLFYSVPAKAKSLVLFQSINFLCYRYFEAGPTSLDPPSYFVCHLFLILCIFSLKLQIALGQ